MKAKASVAKSGLFTRREPLWIPRCATQCLSRSHRLLMCRSIVEKLMALGREMTEFANYALLFLLTYVFLLRMPSEALPATVGNGNCNITCDGNFLVLSLARRKNRPGGSKLTRTCWCRESAETCPIHVLGPVVTSAEQGTKLFQGCPVVYGLSWT